MNKLEYLGYNSLLEVDYVILETSGQISVLPKAEEKSVTLKDLKIKPEYNGYTRVIIMNGVLIKNNLIDLGYNNNWLNNRLKYYKTNIPNTLLFTVDEMGNEYFQKRGE